MTALDLPAPRCGPAVAEVVAAVTALDAASRAFLLFGLLLQLIARRTGKWMPAEASRRPARHFDRGSPVPEERSG